MDEVFKNNIFIKRKLNILKERVKKIFFFLS